MSPLLAAWLRAKAVPQRTAGSRPGLGRRSLLGHAAATLATTLAGSAAAAMPASRVRRGHTLAFPRDHGAHPDFRTEWWYATGWLGTAQAPTHGFQLTFFRSRTGLAADLPGRLAPRQLLFAHAALTDLAGRRHVHDQRLQRWNGDPGLPAEQRAGAAQADGHVWLGDWWLQHDGQGWRGEVGARHGRRPWWLQLSLARTQPVLLQGDNGFSRKGPHDDLASHYYSDTPLTAQLVLHEAGAGPAAAGTRALHGQAWLDHEWAQGILTADAVGWDWVGLNLFDGRALTAFRVRRADGSTVWAGGSLRRPGDRPRSLAADEVRWTPGRTWRSPATGAVYPVQWTLDTPAGRWTVQTLLDAQELDSRASTGTVYWEGLSELLDDTGRRIGLGYLEMTGYAGALRL